MRSIKSILLPIFISLALSTFSQGIVYDTIYVYDTVWIEREHHDMYTVEKEKITTDKISYPKTATFLNNEVIGTDTNQNSYDMKKIILKLLAFNLLTINAPGQVTKDSINSKKELTKGFYGTLGFGVDFRTNTSKAVKGESYSVLTENRFGLFKKINKSYSQTFELSFRYNMISNQLIITPNAIDKSYNENISLKTPTIYYEQLSFGLNYHVLHNVFTHKKSNNKFFLGAGGGLQTSIYANPTWAKNKELYTASNDNAFPLLFTEEIKNKNSFSLLFDFSVLYVFNGSIGAGLKYTLLTNPLSVDYKLHSSSTYSSIGSNDGYFNTFKSYGMINYSIYYFISR